MLLIILSFCASTSVIKATERPNVRALIDSLSKGFTFKWSMENNFMKMKAEGVYRGRNDFEIKGWMKTPEGKMPVSGYNPYEQIKIVCGDKRFIFKESKGSTLIYEFPAILFFLNPAKGMGNGKLYIKNGRIVKIYAETEGAKWEMDIGEYKRPKTEIEVLCDSCSVEKIGERIKLWGGEGVEVKDRFISFYLPSEVDSRIFRKGEITWKILIPERNGPVKDPLDTLFSYRSDGDYRPYIEEAEMGTDPKGRPSVILNIKNPYDGIIGLYVDDTLKATCYGNNPMMIPFRDSIDAKLVYIYLKSGPLKKGPVKIRRLR